MRVKPHRLPTARTVEAIVFPAERDAGVVEDTVRFWRSEFMNGGAEALETRPLPGPEPVKTQAALRVAEPLLSAPVTNRVNWTLARLADEITAREGVTISRSQLSKALRKKGAFAIADPATR